MFKPDSLIAVCSLPAFSARLSHHCISTLLDRVSFFFSRHCR
jgi:hypothetical protein